jgi:HPt (histidine-containing phosphotransfer) domain-containing protein
LIPGIDRESGIGFTGSEKNFEAILRVFNRSAPKMLDQLEAGRRSGQQTPFRTAVHSLISSGANIGALELSARARDLEQAIIAGKAEETDALYTGVHEELERIIAGVRTYITNAEKGSIT